MSGKSYLIWAIGFGCGVGFMLLLVIQRDLQGPRLAAEYDRGLSAGQSSQDAFRHGYQCGFKDGQPPKQQLEIEVEK